MNLGEKIKKARVESGKSQDELANAIGVTRATISRWERGSTSPTMSDINKMSKLIAIDVFEKEPFEDKTDNATSGITTTLEELSHSIEDIRLDLIDLEKARRNMRKTLFVAIILTVIITITVIFAVIILYNWPTSKDEQPLKIEYLNEPINQTIGETNG